MADNTLDLPTRLRIAVAILGNQTIAHKRTGISQARLSNYIRGVNTPSPSVLERLANEAGVRQKWLARGDGPIFDAETPSHVAAADIGGLTDGQLIDELRGRFRRDAEFATIIQHVIEAVTRPQGRRKHEGPRILPACEYAALSPERQKECIPLVGSVAAGGPFSWADEDFPPTSADHYVWMRSAKPGMFAMRIEGASMEPDFPNGAIVIFSGHVLPEKRSVKPALVVYTTDDTGAKRCALKNVSSPQNDIVRLASVNAAIFDPVDIPADRVLHLYAVQTKVSPAEPAFG
jgi:SOS-response transcriptional repressor LexA